jgi:hypothetical protein
VTIQSDSPPPSTSVFWSMKCVFVVNWQFVTLQCNLLRTVCMGMRVCCV